MSKSSAYMDQDRFDQWSEDYEHSFSQWLFFDRVHRSALKRLPADFIPTAVVDVGCGTGRLLRRMQHSWPAAALVGVDPSQGMVSKARQLTPNVTIDQASAEQLPLEDASVDLVTTTLSFHHWTHQSQGVGETCRVLRHGGYFILADTNIGHGHPLSRAQVKVLFQKSGFIIHSQTSFLPFVSITVGRKL